MSTIETLDDWNERLANCECCLMPVCPTPELECESMFGAGFLSGYGGTWGFNEGEAYLKTRFTYQSGVWILYTQSSAIQANLGGKGVMDEITVALTNSGNPSGVSATAYEGAVSVATARSSSYAAMLGALDFTDSDFSIGSYCQAYRINQVPWHGAGNYLSFACLLVQFVRYRWKIPTDFTGSYFKITWDVVFFPKGYKADDSNSPSPSAINRDLTVTWKGPGDPDDPQSWLASDWRAMNPPAQPGETRLVNVRFECYHSPYGNKPQVTGEAVDLDA
ncbi:MAG: hypothetical protein WCP35_14890 [Verrucomicrobiota bacterium]